MAEERTQRRLAAMLAADVVGYSCLGDATMTGQHDGRWPFTAPNTPVSAADSLPS